jgi:hypothetical protein
MVPVKIECECGQNYAFDVEPVNGKMPSAVACPGCGADGTPAANDFIAQQFPSAATAVPNPAPMRLARAQPQVQPHRRRRMIPDESSWSVRREPG